ncbi:hypothetical protein FOHLNKBM_5171 [Methylobacterium longum]|nr:hypothetical protein FOHLNKBM_5171 [Methylobacterium longum]
MQCKDEYAELDRRRHACSIIEVASALRRRDGQECSRKRGLSIVGMQVEAQFLHHFSDNRQHQASIEPGFDGFLKFDPGHASLTDASSHQGRSRLATQHCDDG